jgi:nucleoside-triphosphatase THEP1
MEIKGVVFSPNTIAIIITGEQGKGKSTLANDMAKWLESKNKSVQIVRDMEQVEEIKKYGFSYVIVDF